MPIASRVLPKITPDQITRMLPHSVKREFKVDTLILKEGTKATTCYLILSGRVQISKRMKRGVNYDLALVKKGDFFGEMAMLSGRARSASAKALTVVEALEIKRADFVRLLNKQDPFAARLALHFSSALAMRCSRLLQLLAENPTQAVLGRNKTVDVRKVLHRVYSLWAV